MTKQKSLELYPHGLSIKCQHISLFFFRLVRQQIIIWNSVHSNIMRRSTYDVEIKHGYLWKYGVFSFSIFSERITVTVTFCFSTFSE